LKSAIFSETGFLTSGNTLASVFSEVTRKTVARFLNVETGRYAQAAARPTVIITTGTLKCLISDASYPADIISFL
jgi:hypothetical protein